MSIKRTIITTILALAVVAVVAPGAVQALTVQDLLTQIQQLQAQLQQLQNQEQSGSNTNVTPSVCVGITFQRNLSRSMTGSDVKCLQALLNQLNVNVANTGAGSPGHETTYFGGATRAAVIRFQTLYNISPAVGYVGPITRAKFNGFLGGTVPPPITPPTEGCPAGAIYNSITGALCPVNPPVNPPTGPISATLSFDNPAAGSLVQGQATADLLHINFSGTGTVTSVTLQRSGVSDQNTVSNLYLFDGTTRLTDGYSFNASGTATINGLSIAVSGSKVISVRADIASTCITDGTCGTMAVTLTGYTANGTTSSSNVVGNMFSFITGTPATAYMTTNAATATANVNAGTTQYTMWSDSIQINTRTVHLKGMNFKMIGSAPTNALANIKLFVDGVDSGAVATVGTIQGSNYAMFNFATPISLTTGSHTIDIRADIVTGANRTIQLSVQLAADMTLYDPQLGVNFAVQSAASTAFVADSGTTVTILTGSSTLVVDSTFNSLTSVTAGSTNATIGKFTIHGYGEDVKVNNLYVTPVLISVTAAGSNTCATNASGVWTAGTCGLNNVTLYYNGSQVGTQKNWTMTSASNSTAPLNFTLGSQLIIPAGTDGTLEVKADIQNASSINYTTGSVKVTIEGGGAQADNAQGQSSSEIIDFPTADVTTSGLTVSSASVVVSKNTGYAASTINPNTTNARIGSFTVQNQSSSEATKLTSINVKLYQTAATNTTALSSSSTPVLTNFSALRTSDTTGAGSTPISPTANDTFSVNDVLAPGASMTLDIFANLGSAASGTFHTTVTVASIGAVSNIVDAGTAATGQAITLGAGTVQTPSLVSSSTTSTQYIPSSIASPALSGSQITFNFVSTTAASTISELKFKVTGSDANPSQEITRICVGSICGSPAVTSGSQIVYLTGLNLAVPTGAGLNQNVLVDYAGVGIGGVAPNVTSTVTLTYVKYTSGGTTTAATVSVAAPTITLVGSAPTVTVASTSVSGLTYAGGENKIGEVTIAASSKGSLKINDIKFNVSASNLNASSDFIAESARIAVGSTTVTGSSCGWQAAGATTSRIVFCEFYTDGDATIANAVGETSTQEVNTDFDGYLIPAGQSVTFSLYAAITGTKSTAGSTSTISTSVDKTGFNWDDGSTAIFVADDTATAGTGAVNASTDGTNLNAAGTTQASNIIANWPTTSYSIHD